MISLSYVFLLAARRCEGCGGLLRPHVVWYGEGMEYDTLAKIDLALRNCDLYIQVCHCGLMSVQDFSRSGIRKPSQLFNVQRGWLHGYDGIIAAVGGCISPLFHPPPHQFKPIFCMK